ncbi:hypothetical protein HAX54_050685 [Datura stramonium]|uniref:Uncharacterized protein n=1 Tax=Datura stramonium TaxID=4076 RepID=A0ABS8RR03_DATST|nr:hypothetical protein [Datura stramonium]
MQSFSCEDELPMQPSTVTSSLSLPILDLSLAESMGIADQEIVPGNNLCPPDAAKHKFKEDLGNKSEDLFCSLMTGSADHSSFLRSQSGRRMGRGVLVAMGDMEDGVGVENLAQADFSSAIRPPLIGRNANFKATRNHAEPS